jgi:ADP-ribose pyrophosphatase YjhB (NUDIX family)
MNNFTNCPYDGSALVTDPGKAESRPTCSQCGFIDYQNPKACVAILIVRGQQVLLARRGVEPKKGFWDIPGGFVDASETAEEATVREALEETTLRVRVQEYLGSVPDVYGDRGVPTLNLCFLVEVLRGEPEPKSDVSALEWFELDGVPAEMAFPHQRIAIALLREKLAAAAKRGAR